MEGKRIIITVSNNLVTDNRVAKISGYLEAIGWKPVLLGRRWPGGKIPEGRAGKIKRFNLLFNKGPLFYLELNIRLFFYLLLNSCDRIWAVDLDTLASAILISKIRKIPVTFDSHEYFTEMPELQARPAVKWIWSQLERFLITKADRCVTVSEGIRNIYKIKYGVDALLLRNVPNYPKQLHRLRELSDSPVVYYQGALNVGRGLVESIKAMLYLPNYFMLIVGAGDEQEELQELVNHLQLTDRVIFTGALPFEELAVEAQKAHVGLCLLENMGLNYYHSLPNRLFDYPALGLPIIATAFPDISEIVTNYEIGLLLDNLEPQNIAAAIKTACEDESLREKWALSLPACVKELNWENECRVFEKLL